MRRGEPRNGDAVWRTGHVIHPDSVAETHRAWLTAMLTANADFQRFPDAPTRRDGELDQLADSFLVQHLKRIVGKYATLHVVGQETTGVVAAQPERRLRQIVGAEGEKVGCFRDAVRRQCG